MPMPSMRLQFGGRGRLPIALYRRKVIELIGEVNTADADLVMACGVIGICLRCAPSNAGGRL